MESPVLLIDAFNVLHLPEAHHHGRSLDLAALARLIGTSRYAGQRGVLVCDGGGDGSIELPKGGRGRVCRARCAGLEVLFSGPESTADDEIEGQLRRGGGHGVVVVSDDRRLRRAAKRVRSGSLPSGVFLAHLLLDEARRGERSGQGGPGSGGKGAGKPTPRFARDLPLDRYSVSHWMEEFGMSPNGLLERRAGKPTGRGGTVPRSKPGQGLAPPAPGAAAPDSEAAPKTPAGKETPAEKERSDTLASTPPPPLPDERVLRLESLTDDPVIREALEVWRGRLPLEDLDMARWLDQHRREK